MRYAGWANFHTWNVALWISNDRPLYEAALKYVDNDPSPTYLGFIGSKYMDAEWGSLTGDGVSWTDPTLNHAELDGMIAVLPLHIRRIRNDNAS